MICATRDIILLNKRLDKESRRDVYVPVQISSVSVYDNRQSSEGGGFHSLSDSFKIRIPADSPTENGRSYLPETQYDSLDNAALSGYWTLHTEDSIILCAEPFEDVNTALYEVDENGFISEEAVKQLAEDLGFQKEVIRITGYADNTLRGSNKVKHWRIGGA